MSDKYNPSQNPNQQRPGQGQQNPGKGGSYNPSNPGQNRQGGQGQQTPGQNNPGNRTPR